MKEITKQEEIEKCNCEPPTPKSFWRQTEWNVCTRSRYPLATNGLAEKAVQPVKQCIARQTGGCSLEERFLAFSLTYEYRITPHCMTGVAPSELLLSRVLATRLNRLFPDISDTVKQEQQGQVSRHDSKAQEPCFDKSDRAFVENFSATDLATLRLPAVVTAANRPVSYICWTKQGSAVIMWTKWDQEFKTHRLTAMSCLQLWAWTCHLR